MSKMAHLGLIFPGQGSQYVGMGKLLCENFKEAKELFSIADDVLGYSITKICFEGPEDLLKLTENTQPALLTVSVAVYKVLTTLSEIKVNYMTGHSLGEYSALVASGAMRFEDAVKAVKIRGKLMQEAVPVGIGAMAAVLGLEDFEVEECCKEVDSSLGVVVPANFNAPGQVVISGHIKAINAVSEILKDKGAKKIIPLPVSAPFHSSLMESASLKMKDILDGIEVEFPKVKVISNVTAEPYKNADEIKKLLVMQIKSPVRWVDCVKCMIQNGVNEFLEIGAGKVLSGLVKRIAKDVKTVNLELPDEIKLFIKLFSER